MFYPSNRGFICNFSEDNQDVQIFDFSEHKLVKMPTNGTKGLEIGEFVKTDGKKPVRFDVNEIALNGVEISVDKTTLLLQVMAVCPTTKSLAKELRTTYANKAFSPFLGHLGDSTGLLEEKLFKLGKRVEVIVKFSPNEEKGTVFDVMEIIDSPSRYEEELKKAEAAAAKKLENARKRAEAAKAKKLEDAKRRAEAKKNPGTNVDPVKRGVQKKPKVRVLTRAQKAKAAAELAGNC